LFVCEDNRISATTPTPALTGGAGAAARAESIGVPAVSVDGNDVEAVDAATARIVAQVRAHEGPRLLHAVTYRFKGHVSIDPGAYRDPAEVARALEADPLRLARERLLARGMSTADIVAIDDAARPRSTRRSPSRSRHPHRIPPRRTDVQNTGAGRWR
jgi:pyruvate dehydrogenase E1 component alpha subunit